MTMRYVPVGIEDFAKIRRENMYYVDKTGMIKELFTIGSDVTLFTRPRRFGKTLNMSMLRYFFEIGTDKSLFDGLAISEEKELCEKHMGQYPVISISLKDVIGSTYEEACEKLRWVMMREAKRFGFLETSSILSKSDKIWFESLINGTAPISQMLDQLAVIIHIHYGKKVVILIDEYDVPLANAERYGYFNEMLPTIRSFLSTALKTSSDRMAFAVMTGCLRVSKESIFTGLNHFTVNTIIDKKFDEWFGFTDQEVRDMLDYYGLGAHYEVTKNWYDGYTFGEQDVYNPWDVTNRCRDLIDDNTAEPKNYWANTSSNVVIKEFAEIANSRIREQLGHLIDGGTIVKRVTMDMTYSEIYKKPENLWSLLYATGYLTRRGIDENGDFILAIPNREVQLIYKDTIEAWFTDKAMDSSDDLNELIESFANADANAISYNLDIIMSNSISYHDCNEAFYHGLLLGMLTSNGMWEVISNREAGHGRFDIAVKATMRSRVDFGFIIEVKHTTDKASMQRLAIEALSQIEDNKYDEYFSRNDRSKIAKYGIVFCGKECCVVKSAADE